MAYCLQGIDIRAVMKIVAQVERHERPREEAFTEAWHIITEKNPLPSTCGRVCPHPCEEQCVRQEIDGAVAVNSIERFIGDWGLAHGFKFTRLIEERQPEKIAVIGSGPAGLSCAYHLARRGYSVTVFEASPQPGGMLRYGIPSYRLPRQVLDAEINRILDLGIELHTAVMVGRDVTLEQLRTEYDAIFVGIGAQKAARLRIPGDGAAGVFGGVEFLRLVNSGQAVELGQEVVVVGGGNTAIDAARVSRRLGAKVTLLYRRTRAEMPAISAEINAALEEGVEIIYLAAPIEIQSNKSLLCQRMQLGEPDASGRPKPIPIPGDVFTLKADTLIAAIAQETNWDGLEMVQEVKSADQTIPTGSPGADNVFSGGDVLELGLVAQSILHGRYAAQAMHAKFRGLSREERYTSYWDYAAEAIYAKSRGLPLPEPLELEVISRDRLHLDVIQRSPRHEMAHLNAAARLKDPWKEATTTLPLQSAVDEASRCLSCGESFIKRPKTHPLHLARRISQIGIGTFLFNSYIGVFSTKMLYGGPLRNLCVPGLNCHSCPTATMGCPIGMMQHFSATHRFPWFLLGFLGLMGLLSGRFTCGWLCPWGMIQDVMNRIKRFAVRLPKWLIYLKYAVLIVVVIIIPYITFTHWFSRLCPCGALIAALPWAIWNPTDPVLGEPYIMEGMIGALFWTKMAILGFFLGLFLFIKRPFCRTVCPLGAIYALFNRLSLVSVKVGEGCVDCGQCRAVCPTDLDVRREANGEGCVKCLECTQCQHIKFHINRFWEIKLKKRLSKRRVPELQPREAFSAPVEQLKV